MLDYRDLLYFFICLLFMTQVFHNGGFADYNLFPVSVPVFLFFAFSLFYIFRLRPGASAGGALAKAVLINCSLYLAGGLFSQCIQISLVEMMKHLAGALLFFIIYSLVRTRDDLRVFLKALLVLVQIYIFLALAYYFAARANGIPLTGVCYTLYYPYYHATFALVFIPPALYFYLTSHGAAAANYFVFLAALAFSVVMTSSRVAQLSLFFAFASVCASAFFLRGRGRKTLAALAALAVISAAGFLFATDAFHRIVNTFDAAESYDAYDHSGRLNIYRAALKTAADYPYFGVGPGLSAHFIVRHRLTSGFLNDCHNLALNVLCESGIFYFTAWLVFWLFCAWLLLSNAWRSYRALKKSIVRASEGGPVRLEASAPDGAPGEGFLMAVFPAASLAVLHLQGFSMPHTYLGALVLLEYILLAVAAVSLDLSSRAAPGEGGEGAAPGGVSFARREFLAAALLSFAFFFTLSFVLFSEAPDSFTYWTVGMTFLAPVVYFGVKGAAGASAPSGAAIPAFVKSPAAVMLGFLVLCSLWMYKAGILSHMAFGEADSGSHAAAVEKFSRSLECFVTMPAALGMASSSLYTGKYKDALAFSEFYNGRLPYEIFGLHMLAASLIKLNQTERADVILKKYSDNIPADFGDAFYGAFLMERPSSFDAGIERFARACVETPDFLRTSFFVRSFVKDKAALDKFLVHFKKRAAENQFVRTGKYSSYISSCLGRASLYLFLSGAISAAEMLNGSLMPSGHARAANNIISREFKDLSPIRSFLLSKRFIRFCGPATAGLMRMVFAPEPPSVPAYNPYIHMGHKRLMSQNTLYDVYGLRNHLLMPPAQLAALGQLVMGRDGYRRFFLEFYGRDL